MTASGPIDVLIAECAARSDVRVLPVDVVYAVAAALADAIVADIGLEAASPTDAFASLLNAESPTIRRVLS